MDPNYYILLKIINGIHKFECMPKSWYLQLIDNSEDVKKSSSIWSQTIQYNSIENCKF